ncbi:type III-B CRISPR module-associated Cmr3 family protein [Clostridium oryzae]|uniref:CRISPR-associated protein n=1 Tax=Clostridium oryzae TaxID=1450648 RepID=A0A1V4ISI3_9CLOT|nr:type III-B CRISPR module-associated Cmr3 family protein [Clostridium oryzae]OPJ62770.1 CRISPR-associated protein [Clostridium oryzae]
MELLSIKPCDNTFFRDGSAYGKGINNYICSKNTPYPSVFFGAIYSVLLSENNEFRKLFFEKGNYDHQNILNIGNVYLYNEKIEKAYIKAPKDLFVNSNSNVLFGDFEVRDAKFKSITLDKILQSPVDRDYKKADKKYINVDDVFHAYAKHQSFIINLIDEGDIFVKNKKIGLKIETLKRTAQDKCLYRIEQTEFVNNDWTYIVEYKINMNYLKQKYGMTIKDLTSGYLKLGGESKAARYIKVKNDSVEKFNREYEMHEKSIVKVLFISEVIFEKGIEEIFENKVKVLGLATDKPIYIGGYDMKNNGKGSVRKMYKGYSAGTVALLEVETPMKLKKEFHDAKGFNRYVVLEEV